MAAKVERFESSRSHCSAFRLNPIASLSTARWCHSTPRASGTSPRIFRLIRLITAPYNPVTSASGTRVLLDISASSDHRQTWRRRACPACDISSGNGSSGLSMHNEVAPPRHHSHPLVGRRTGSHVRSVPLKLTGTLAVLGATVVVAPASTASPGVGGDAEGRSVPSAGITVQPDGTTTRVAVAGVTERTSSSGGDPDLEPGFPVSTYEHGGSYHAGPAINVLIGDLDRDRRTARASRRKRRWRSRHTGASR